MEGDPTFVAGAAALGAAASAIERNLRQTLIQKIAAQCLRRWKVGFLAMLADPGRQPLREDADDRRGDHEGLHADLQQPDDGLRRGIRMQGGENKVSGERRLGGDLGGFQIADFANEDHIGVLAQQGAQDRGEFQVDMGVDLALGDSGQLDFHRIFNGGDVQVRLVDFV